MPDRHHHASMTRDESLATALRRIAPQAPPNDLWPLLAARVRRRRRWHLGLHMALPAALAAGIALAVVLLPRHTADAPSPARITTHTPATGHDDVARQLLAWQRHSQRLQAWIKQLGEAGAPLDGNTLARVAELQDRIGLVDLQLGAARTPHAQLPLWRRRVALLEQLAALRLDAGTTSMASAI